MIPVESKDLLAVLDAMSDGIYIVRHDYTVEYMNRVMIERFGEGVGKKCYEVINQSEVLCPWCRAEEVFVGGNSTQSEIYIPHQEKTYQIIELPIQNKDGTLSKLNIYRDITATRDQALRLAAKEKDYQRLFEHVGVGVYVSTKKGRFLDANPALLEMLGYDSKEEFLQIRIQEDLYRKPEDRLAFQRMIEEDGRVASYAVDFKRKDGTTLPVLLTSQLRRDHAGQIIGYEGICVDQSQVVTLTQTIRETHDLLHKIVRSSPNAIIGADMQGLIIVWNQGAEETLGYTEAETVGKMDVRELYEEEQAYEVMASMRGSDFGGPGKLRAYPMTFKHKDGRLVEGSLSASLIYDDKGRETASVGFFVDLGERLAMERQLSRTQEQLLQSEKLAAMGRLTSQLAHELNNPLYGIMNTLELMKTEIAPDNKRRRLLEMALSETERLTDMLRKMLSFSRPDQETRSVVDMNEILDEILLLHEKQLRENDIKVAIDLAGRVPPVWGSKSQLRQVFLNMVSNARDAMPEGGTLTVRTSTANGNVKIQISDDGTGIRPENLDKIFDTFFTTKTDSARGVGLGLSVCYGFIKDHGGDIQVDSRWGQGTTFTIYLPIQHNANV
jgi:two-component system NtrC family sensor kinase